MTRVLILTVVLLAGCSTVPDASQRPLNPGTDWVANSSEWRQEAADVYQRATQYALLTGTQFGKNSWVVIMDLDETVLNNVEYQVRLERAGQTYSPQSWYQWTQEEAATLVPGAMSFIKAVNKAGGHVAFVTNRKDFEQLATENNLAKLGLSRGKHFRVLLTRATPQGGGEKDQRFAMVTKLLEAQGYPDTQVIAYIGDNVGDKPKIESSQKFFCIDQGAMYGEPCAQVPGPGR
ncbi:MAG: HAD family acid phosphatase [Lysobacterales bacterium]